MKRILGLSASLAVTAACGDDRAPAPADETDSDSGFVTDTSTSPTATSPTLSTTGTATLPTSNSQGPGTATSTGTTGDPMTSSDYETLGLGDLRGTLAFTYFAADAVNDDPILGMAGAFRDVELGFEDVHDFFGIYALGINFPAPPEDEDTLEHNDIPVDFEWGAPGDWLLAGNSMKLRLPDSEAHACLLYRGGTPEVELPPGSGMFFPNYPIYAATSSSNQPEECRPDAAAWLADTDYDIVLYGGELFETNSLVAQVHTPTDLEVTAPDLAEFQLPIDVTQSLDVEWTGEGLAGNQIVIRVFDAFGRMFTIHAADDGAYTIPADDLAQLSVGAGTIIVSRENVEEVPFTEGIVDVVSRFEQWGYVDFY